MKGPPIFIPPPPNKARLQVLLTFSGERDLRGPDRGLGVALLGKKERRGFSLAKPYGVAIRGGRVFITDTVADSIIVADIARRKFFTLPGVVGEGVTKVPVSILFSPDGKLYVTDPHRKMVLVYDERGAFDHKIGDGKSWKPSGLAIYKNRLYVSDMSSSQVLIFDRKTEKQIGKFGGPGTAPGQTGYPTNLAVDSKGNVYVAETTTGRVQKFSPDGQLLGQFGSLGTSLGQMVRPKGLALDHDDNLYVVDASTQVVQIFNKQGQLLLPFGGRGYQAGSFDMPAGVGITYDKESIEVMKRYAASDFTIKYLVAVVSQLGPRKITILGFGDRAGDPPDKPAPPEEEPASQEAATDDI